MTASRPKRDKPGKLLPLIASRRRDAGFTLVEVIVALALFALVALAGTAMVDTILGAEARTAGRLTRLADMQRAMVVISRDLTEIADAPLTGGPAGVAFDRYGVHGPFGTEYSFSGMSFERTAGGRRQVILDGITTARWRFYAVPGSWLDHWPPSPAEASAWPLAVAVNITLAAGSGPHGTLRRIVALPARPLPSGMAP